jgi:hypothetical protein
MRESWVSGMTFGPSGTLWISHGEVSEFSKYDGYQFHVVSPSPGRDLRIIEDESRRLWALKLGGAGGFQQFIDGKWVLFPIPENETDAYILRQVPFAPLPSNKLLYLLPQALFQYDTVNHSIRRILKSDDTRLGAFLDMTYVPGDGIWLTGDNGIVRIPEVPENAGTLKFQEEVVPPGFGVHGLTRPIRCLKGELFTAARDLRSGR